MRTWDLHGWIRFLRRGAADTETSDPAVDALFSLAGVEPAVVAEAQRRLADRLAHAGALGVSTADLTVLGQAYIRAVGRVVAAEAQVISAIKDAHGPAGSARHAQLIDAARSIAPDMFGLLHSAMLTKALAEDASSFGRRQSSDQPVAVAHVDVVGSTALLAGASAADTQRMVDGLFTSAQSALHGLSVEAIKYVGDGVFLAGSEPAQVAAASLACLQRLGGEFGLPARAGMAVGAVVHRAGDLFGMAVNLAHALTKAADPGTLLVSDAAALALDPRNRSAPRRLTVPGLPEPIFVYVVHAPDDHHGAANGVTREPGGPAHGDPMYAL